jgi:hypothetical protein
VLLSGRQKISENQPPNTLHTAKNQRNEGRPRPSAADFKLANTESVLVTAIAAFRARIDCPQSTARHTFRCCQRAYICAASLGSMLALSFLCLAAIPTQ